jgi:hypothetical protein
MSIIVRDYRGLAVYCFRKVLIGTFPVLCEQGYADDVQQEIDLASWQAERDQLATQPAMRFFCRAAYHFLRSLGYRYARVDGKRLWVASV